ncbi:MAG: transcriptional repressor [Opitutaceae bacterium]
MIESNPTHSPLALDGAARVSPKNPVELATDRLRAAGLRITQPRLAILAALAQRAQPTSIEQLHHVVGAAKCDLVTVYRCVAAFEEIGLVRRAFLHNGTSLYEINVGEPTRYHVVCKSTNRVDELDAETAAELRRTIQEIQDKLRAKGYDEVGHIVEFFGVAPLAPEQKSLAPATKPH